MLKEGDARSMRWSSTSIARTRSINLSIKAKDSAEQQEAIRGLASADSSTAATGTTNLGALLKAKLDGQNG